MRNPVDVLQTSGVTAFTRRLTGPSSSVQITVASSGGWVGVEADDPCPFGTKSRSFDRIQDRAPRHRIPSASSSRLTCERPTSIPSARAAAPRESGVHSDGPDSSKAHSSPTGSHRSRPGGTVLTREMIRDRSSSVIRRPLRPCPPRSSSPCRPKRLKRCSQQRTVFWLQSGSTAIAGTRSPDQLSSVRADGPDAVVLPPFLHKEVKQHLAWFAEKGHEDPQPSGGRRADPGPPTRTCRQRPPSAEEGGQAGAAQRVSGSAPASVRCRPPGRRGAWPCRGHRARARREGGPGPGPRRTGSSGRRRVARRREPRRRRR